MVKLFQVVVMVGDVVVFLQLCKEFVVVVQFFDQLGDFVVGVGVCGVGVECGDDEMGDVYLVFLGGLYVFVGKYQLEDVVLFVWKLVVIGQQGCGGCILCYYVLGGCVDDGWVGFEGVEYVLKMGCDVLWWGVFWFWWMIQCEYEYVFVFGFGEYEVGGELVEYFG